MKLQLDSSLNADELKGSSPVTTNSHLLNLFMGVTYSFADVEKVVNIDAEIGGWKEDPRNPDKNADIIYDTELNAWLPIPEYYLYKELIEMYQQPIKAVSYMQGKKVWTESGEVIEENNSNSYKVIVKLPYDERKVKIN
jgi:hypothetical protein